MHCNCVYRRIHKYLPGKKKLQDNKEPRATAKNKENLKRLEEEQKVRIFLIIILLSGYVYKYG